MFSPLVGKLVVQSISRKVSWAVEIIPLTARMNQLHRKKFVCYKNAKELKMYSLLPTRMQQLLDLSMLAATASMQQKLEIRLKLSCYKETTAALEKGFLLQGCCSCLKIIWFSSKMHIAQGLKISLL